MKFKPFFVILISVFIFSCNEDSEYLLFANLESPDPEYPFTYYPLNTQEMDSFLNAFDTINQHEELTINEFGMLTGTIQFSDTVTVDAEFIYNSVSDILNRYSSFLWINEPETIELEKDLHTHDNGGMSISIDDYFDNQNNSKSIIYTHIEQEKIGEKTIMNSVMSFVFDKNYHQITVYGHWYPEVLFPTKDIISAHHALQIATQYIKDNYQDYLPIDTNGVDPHKFNKYIFPAVFDDKIEMHECWRISFWGSAIGVLVDTQTGKVIWSEYYGGMI